MDKMSEYANWGKLLYECIWVYGNDVDFSDEYYHGLCRKFIFSEFVLPLKIPISTSTSIDVANNFMGQNGGMVITFKNRYSKLKHQRCLSVKMFSNFDYEEEILFFENNFVIYDMYIDFKMKKYFKNDLVNSYLLLNAIFKGQRFDLLSGNNNESILLSINNQEKLVHFIKFIINESNQSNPYYNYFSLCLQHTLQNNVVHINKYYILRVIKANMLIKELVSLLFDYNNIYTLKPGIFFTEIEKQFLKKHYLLYNTSCDPRKLVLNLENITKIRYDLKYVISLANNDEITILFIITFEMNRGVLGFDCTQKISIPHTTCMYFLECTHMDMYENQMIAGGNKASSFVYIIPEHLCEPTLTFTLSFLLMAYMDKRMFFTYDNIYGM